MYTNDILPVTTAFFGREREIDQWQKLLEVPENKGYAVVVVGKYGMGKTWLLDTLIRKANENPAFRCFSVRYVVGVGESPGMVLRIILDDMFQAARYEVGSLNTDGKRFRQWIPMYRGLDFFTVSNPQILEQLQFDNRKNIFEQFMIRLKLFSHLLPENGRLIFALDPEHDTSAARVELWTQVIKNLPPKIVFLFAQRFKDSLTINEEFSSQPNVHFIPPLDPQGYGLSDLSQEETEKLLHVYLPICQEKKIDPKAVSDHFRMYRNHPFAVHAALNLLLSSPIRSADQLPKEPMPAAVCPVLWEGIASSPFGEDAVRLIKTYALLEVPTLDEMACWVADISPERLNEILTDPFLGAMVRSEAEGRLLYHHHLAAYVRSLLSPRDTALTDDALQLHQRAMEGYSDLVNRSLKPDVLSTVRLAEHSLVIGGPTLFAETLCRCSEDFFSSGFYQTYASLIDRALVLVPPISSETVDLYYLLGKLRRRQKDYESASQCYQSALQMAKKIVLPERIAAILLGLGYNSLERGAFIEADMWLRDAILYYESESNTSGSIESSVLAAEVRWVQGDTVKAEKLLRSALKAAEEIKHYRQKAKLISIVLVAWGRMFEEQGDIKQSTEQYHKALELAKEIYDREAEAGIQTSISTIYERIGNLKSAEEHLSDAMAIYQDLKSLECYAESSILLARVMEMQGKPQARDLYIEQAKKVYHQLGNFKKLDELNQ